MILDLQMRKLRLSAVDRFAAPAMQLTVEKLGYEPKTGSKQDLDRTSVPPESFGRRHCLDTDSSRILAHKGAHVLLPEICDMQRDLKGVLELRV